MSQFHFREANVHEAPAIAQLVNDAYRPKPDVRGWTHESDFVSGNRTNSEQVERLIQKKESVILLGLNGVQVFACIHIEWHGTEAHFGMLAVEPALQAAGAGKALLAHAEEYASSILGAKCFVLDVIEARKELVAFYLRRGYEKTVRVVPYPRNAGAGTPIHDTLNVVEMRKRYNNSLQARRP